MSATVALRNIVGENLKVFAVAVVPLHRDFNGDARFFADAIKDVFVQNGLCFVDVLNEAFDTARIREVFAFSRALIDQLDLDSVVQK